MRTGMKVGAEVVTMAKAEDVVGVASLGDACGLVCGAFGPEGVEVSRSQHATLSVYPLLHARSSRRGRGCSCTRTHAPDAKGNFFEGFPRIYTPSRVAVIDERVTISPPQPQKNHKAPRRSAEIKKNFYGPVGGGNTDDSPPSNRVAGGGQVDDASVVPNSPSFHHKLRG